MHYLYEQLNHDDFLQNMNNNIITYGSFNNFQSKIDIRKFLKYIFFEKIYK